MINISVIVCCYNSADRITPTLQHLAKQKLDGLVCELLLVDNNSTDITSEISSNVWRRNNSPYPLRIIEEKKPGLSYARRAGALSALGEVFVFCDDDNWLNDEYLLTAYNFMKQNKNVFGICGSCEPFAEIQIPDWFYQCCGLYACGIPTLLNIKTNQVVSLWGAGMVVRGTILKNLYKSGITHFSTDRKSNNLSSGGDDEISLWLRLIGGKLLYVKELRLTHFMDAKRLEHQYLEKLIQGIRNSKRELKYFGNIQTKILEPIGKRDLIFTFYLNDKGKICRAKFGFYFGLDSRIVNNVRILKNLRFQFERNQEF